MKGAAVKLKKNPPDFDEFYVVRRSLSVCVAALALGGLACMSPNPQFVEAERGGDAGTTPDMAAGVDARGAADAARLPDAAPIKDGPPEQGADAPVAVDVVVPADVAPAVDALVALDTPPADAPFTCQMPATGTGVGLQAEYFRNTDFTGTRVSQVDQTIDWNWGANSPNASLDDDNFSVRWTGQLLPLASGPHTFVATYNDGMRMFLDDRVVMYRWGPHLTSTEERATVTLQGGRRYDLRFEFLEVGSAAIARLAWETPCGAKEVVPRRQLYPVAPAAPVCPSERPNGTGSGLKVEYFTGEPGQGKVGMGKDARVDFAWQTGPPASNVPSDFSARWTGTLEAPIDGPLTLYLHADDVARLSLDGKSLMSSWSEPFGPQEIAATVDVRAGQRYDLTIDLRDNEGGAFIHLSWSWPCHPREVIPTHRLYPAP